MSLVFKDRVKVTTSTSGTGTLSLGSAVAGFQSFSVIGNGNTTYYTIADQSGNWEVGIGTYIASGNTLSRDTVLDSSTGSIVDFPSGSKTVFVTYPASKAVTLGNLPTMLPVTTRASSVVDIPLTNGYLPVLNHSGSTINVAVS